MCYYVIRSPLWREQVRMSEVATSNARAAEVSKIPGAAPSFGHGRPVTLSEADGQSARFQGPIQAS
jgi:hypothetical protein